MYSYRKKATREHHPGSGEDFDLKGHKPKRMETTGIDFVEILKHSVE